MAGLEALEGQVPSDDDRDHAYPHRRGPAINYHVPFQEKPAEVRDCDHEKNQSGDKRECLLAHSMPPLHTADDRMLPHDGVAVPNYNFPAQNATAALGVTS